MLHSKALRQSLQLNFDVVMMRGGSFREAAEETIRQTPQDKIAIADTRQALLNLLISEARQLGKEKIDQEILDRQCPNLPRLVRDFLAGSSKLVCVGSNIHKFRWLATRDEIRQSRTAKDKLIGQIEQSRDIDNEHIDMLEMLGIDSFAELCEPRQIIDVDYEEAS